MRISLHLLAVLAVLVVVILLLPAYGGPSPTTRASSPPSGASTDSALPIVPATLSLGGALGIHLDAPFYGLVLSTAGLGPRAAAGLGQFFNSTPLTVFRVGGGLDAYDPTTGLDYVPPASGGTFQPIAQEMVNFTWFKAWCDSRTPSCQWIGSLPAEQNNTALALHYARWYHDVLGFAPTFWQFGNEPNAWMHYGENLTVWSTTDASTPTGPAYGTMVKDYIAAIGKVFPQDKFIGIEDNCACNPSLVSSTTSIDGSRLSAMAYHSYPWAENSSTILSQFFGALSSARNLSTTANHMRQLDASGCSSCGSLPIQLGEYNAGPVPIHSPYAFLYPGAAFLAGSIIQAIQANVSMLTIFELSYLYNATTAAVQPQGRLLQTILENLTMGTDYNVTVHDGNLNGVFALLVHNGTRRALLLVNDNITSAVSVSVGRGLFPVGLLGSEWSWSPSLVDPIFSHGILVPTSFLIGSQGMVLLTNY
jgi:hypothetical protein